MCSGVVPQQPPTILTRPGLRELADHARHDAGRLVVAADTRSAVRHSDAADVASRRCARAPRRAAAASRRARSSSPGERLRVPHRVPERFASAPRASGRRVGDRPGDHHRQPQRRRARTTFSMAKIAALAFSVSNTVSTIGSGRRRRPRARALPRCKPRPADERDVARTWSLTSGEMTRSCVVGPSTPATKRGRSGVCAVISSAASRASLAAARLIS